MTTRIVSQLTDAQRRSLRADLEREFQRLEPTGRGGALVAAVANALQRLDEGTYGLCVVCGGTIPYARLSVLPETERCRACSRG
jgi:RNA polymerase-binding transcription factor DksA